MRIDVRYAGLDSDMERRVRFAANGMSAHRVQAEATAWDGTRCHLLVTDAEDVYGLSAVDLARRRDTPIVAFTDDMDRPDTWAIWLRRETSVASLTKILLQALGYDLHGTLSTPSRPPSTITRALDLEGLHSKSGLVRLALEPALSHKDLEARFDGRRMQLLPRNGRLLATNASDLLSVRDRLCDEGWDFRPLDPRRAKGVYEHAISIDAIYLDAAMRAQGRLPAFPAGTCWLCDWPDLGQAPEHVVALRVAQQLLRGKIESNEIAARIDAAPSEVAACLWAFAASGVLQHAGSPDVIQPLAVASQGARTVRFSKLLSKLASHFGLTNR